MLRVVAVQNMVDLVANNMEAENCKADASLVAFHANTLQHIVLQKAKEGKISSQYKDVRI